jgi:hypothetical protein
MLTNPNPIEVPAVAARVYDKLHLFSLAAENPKTGKGMLSVNLLPATSDGEVASFDKVQRIGCHLHPALEEVPELAVAFAAIIAAIPATQAWLAAQTTEDAPSE